MAHPARHREKSREIPASGGPNLGCSASLRRLYIKVREVPGGQVSGSAFWYECKCEVKSNVYTLIVIKES